LLWGLYRSEHESTIEFKDWATDVPVALADAAVDAWKDGSPSRADTRAVKSFIEDKLGGWIARQVS